MIPFLFILGRKSELCFAEMSEVVGTRYPKAQVIRVAESAALVELPDIEAAQNLQTVLGGTMKIVKVVSSGPNLGTLALEGKVAEIFEGIARNNKITFGIGEIGRESLDALSHSEVKKILKDRSISSRFVDSVRSGLSASVLLHQDVEEVMVVKSGDQVILGYTISVQNIDDWTRRDREKPGTDRRRGMLPPKLARIMVNLALPASGKQRLMDPFCGTGTVLLEGLMLGKEVIGSDIRADALNQTTANLKWFEKAYPGSYKHHVFMADATQVTDKDTGGLIDAIAAEGLLGPMTPGNKELPNIFKGLEKLYLGCLKQWTRILRPGSRVVLALPLVASGKVPYSLERLIDRCREFGYNTHLSPLIYDRPEAIVKRQIFILDYKG